MSNIPQFTGNFNKKTIPHTAEMQMVYAYFEIKPPLGKTREQRLPLNICLLLDKSGSMQGERIERLREAVKILIDQLEPTDYISIVAFNNQAELLVKNTAVNNPRKLKKQVDKLLSGGTTFMEKGLKMGLDELIKHTSPDRVSRLIVLTDGDTASERKCLEQTDHAKALGIPIIALGLGHDWKETFLEKLASGYVDQIKQPEDIVTIFQEVFSQMMVFAQNVSVKIRPIPDIITRRVWQVTPLIEDISQQVIDTQITQINFPELTETGVSYLVELILPSRPPGEYCFLQADLDCTVEGIRQETCTLTLPTTVFAETAFPQQVNQHVMDIVERVTAYRLQMQALADYEVGDRISATRRLRAAQTRFLGQGEFELAETVRLEADSLERGEDISNQGRKTMLLTSRKTIHLAE